MVHTRRSFLANVGRGTLLASLGPALAVDMGIVSRTWADEPDAPLNFGQLESLVAMMQDSPIEQLQTRLFDQLEKGTALKTLVAAGVLANARTFGGEDYIGFHTFMALGPALKMAGQMPDGSAALPVFKVLYRNTKRIQDHGGHDSEVLHQISPASSQINPSDADLRAAIRSKDMGKAESLLSAMVAHDRQSALDALIPAVQDNPEVHRTVLPYRAWEMQDIVGTEHACTLLRQSLRYCLKAETYRRPEWDEHGKMLTSMLDEYKLEGKSFGDRQADDNVVLHLADVFANGSPTDAARAAANALADGFTSASIGEAISLAASRLVLRDGGRLPQYEELYKPAGGVHGDSIGVHGSDTANAWRNMAKYSNTRNGFACLIMGAWQIARDRTYSQNLLTAPLPAKHHLNRLANQNPDELLVKLDDAIRNNMQGHAVAATKLLSETSVDPHRVFALLLKYAVSEDGALHAEKYFHTVWDDFHNTRPALRWQHLMGLSRVTASEFGRPAPGQDEARRLFGLT